MYSNPSIYVAVGSKKRRCKSERCKSNFILLILQSSLFLTRNLKMLHELTVIPRFTSQLVPAKGDVNRMTTQIEVRGNAKFGDINCNNIKRDSVNRRSAHTLIPRFPSIRSASASKLCLFKITVISKLRRLCFSLRRMFQSCAVSASICVVNTKMFVRS